MKKSILTLNDLREAFETTELYPTPISAELYKRAEAEGFSMTGYYIDPWERACEN